MLHAHPRESFSIVTATVPVRVGHEDAALDIAQSNGRRVCLHTA